MSMELSPRRSANLGAKLFEALEVCELPAPNREESEPSFTRRTLSEIVRAELKALSGIPLVFRGDGGESRAVPASALGIDFYPDLAVSIGHQNIWAAEVKFLRQTNRQNSIATALGQATMYRTRYEHVALILVDLDPVDRRLQRKLAQQAKGFDLDVVVRSKSGPLLLPQT
jgi:hypothetical protein